MFLVLGYSKQKLEGIIKITKDLVEEPLGHIGFVLVLL